MTTLRTLSQRISKAIKIENHDVQGNVVPNIREFRAGSHAAIEVLVQNFHDWKEIGPLRKLPKTQLVFEETLQAVKRDLDEHGRWSFWHYATLCVVTCFACVELFKQNKHQELEIGSPETWDKYPWESAVLAINYIAKILHPTALSRLQEIAEADDVDIRDVCKTLLWHMEQLH